MVMMVMFADLIIEYFLKFNLVFFGKLSTLYCFLDESNRAGYVRFFVQFNQFKL